MESSTIAPGPLDTTGDVDEHNVEENGEDAYARELAAAREAEGLDPETSLPVSADHDPNARDISAGIELQGMPDDVQLSFHGIGGKRPEESKLRVVGGAFSVPGNLEKGSIVNVELELRIGGVAFDDTIDPKTTQATSCTRSHKGRVIGATLIDASAIEKLSDLTEAVQGLLAGTVSEDVVRAIVERGA